jgi:hypothetical protein
MHVNLELAVWECNLLAGSRWGFLSGWEAVSVSLALDRLWDLEVLSGHGRATWASADDRSPPS